MSFKAHCDLCGSEISDGTRGLIVFDATKELNGQAPLHICFFCKQNIIYWNGRAEEGRLRRFPVHECKTCTFFDAKLKACMCTAEGEHYTANDGINNPCWIEKGDVNDGLS